MNTDGAASLFIQAESHFGLPEWLFYLKSKKYLGSGPDFYFILDLPTTSTEFPFDQANDPFILQPNPVQEGAFIQIRADLEIESGPATLYDNPGRVVWRGDISDGAKPYSLRAPGVAGVYFLNLETKGGLAIKKIIVVK